MKNTLFFILFLFTGISAFATHNRAGEILFKHIFASTYEITVVIYADPGSPAFTRKEIEINWGDNSGIDSLRVTSETKISNTVSKRLWVSRHSFPGPGNYTISVTDLNRNAGVNNIDNSSQVPFYVETLLRISPFAEDANNSVILLNDPIDEACIGQLFIHNPGAFDPDGDSLAYEISSSKTLDGLVAPGFQFPPASNSIFVDPLSGDLIWDTPTTAGQYNIAILIKEYRNDILLSTVLRDMQIDVNEFCDNNPPDIMLNDKYCVEAGQVLSFEVNAKDRNSADKVTLSATGGPFEVANNPANFNVPPPFNPIKGLFSWSTLCEHRRAALYNLSFKAVDNADQRGSPQLSSFKNADIKIIAPAPQNFQLISRSNYIELSWDPSVCKEAIGYKLYRRRDSSGFVPDSCTLGVPEETGFEQIAFLDHLDSTHYIDNNHGEGLVPGQKYCYMLVANFSDGDDSYASVELCGKVERYSPIITLSSVVNTDAMNGSVDLRWSPPQISGAVTDPLLYRYLLYSLDEFGNYILLDSTNSLYDTLYTAVQLNTKDLQHSFRVDLWELGSGRNLLARSTPASTVYLQASSFDKQIHLSWNSNTPWNNYEYIIYRQNPLSLSFDSIGSANSSFYIDSNLINGKEYCYKIKSIGDLQIDSVPSPIINFSQEACAIPLDRTPPCPPTFDLEVECNFGRIDISWEKGDTSCSGDIVAYHIYKSEQFSEELRVIARVEGINNNTITLDTNDFASIAGCYAVTAIDSNRNESTWSDTVCLDICPTYKLPNVMTPNGDGHNDLFIPFPYLYVDSIDLSILNRWGQVVFQTNNPDINWTGLHYKEKEMVSAGVYFYVCTVYQQGLHGIQKTLLKGTLTVIDPQSPTPKK